MRDHYSPLRYPGGKARLSSFLISVLEENGIRRPEYIEPYAGGAGSALRLLFEEYVETITINDADPRIRCFWQAVTRKPDEFVELLMTVPLSVDEWVRQRAIYGARDLRKVLDLGFATFYLNRTTRSGIIHNGGPIGGHDQRGKYGIDARFNRATLARRIHRIGLYSDRIEVSGADGLELLELIDKDSARALRAFVYLDPPYFAKGNELYMNRFTPAEHGHLARFLAADRGFNWVMTYDDVPEIRKLYAWSARIPFSLSYSAYESRKGQELLIHPSSVQIPIESIECLPAVPA